jgi:hypothetical protein
MIERTQAVSGAMGQLDSIAVQPRRGTVDSHARAVFPRQLARERLLQRVTHGREVRGEPRCSAAC